MEAKQIFKLLIAFVMLIVALGFQLAFWLTAIIPTALYDYTILFSALAFGGFLFSSALKNKRPLLVALYIPVMFILLFYTGFVIACLNGACL